jgi:L-alanine-DL-glutamate epimerase-like enolase superfamily enzyme
MLAAPLAIDRDGLLRVPAAPGLGLELSSAATRALDAA